MMTLRLHKTIGLAVLLAGAVLASAAMAGESTSPSGCDERATAYDRWADDYAAGAGRYRAWARAEEILASGGDESALDLAQQAMRLDEAAKTSRERAAEFRSREGSTNLSPGGCGIGAIGTKG